MDQPDTTALEEKAIKEALVCHWEQAIAANNEILELNKKNIAALNRLGIAYLKTNQTKLAKKTFQEALKISPHSSIAQKNLVKIKHLLVSDSNNQPAVANITNFNPISFIEEPGISKIVPLIKPGSHQIISDLAIGQILYMKSSARKTKLVNGDNQYIGRLPDNLSLKISKFIKAGYKYQVFVKSTDPQSPSIYIQEIKRSKRLKEIPTFSGQNTSIKNFSLYPQTVSVPPLEIYDPLEENE